MIQSPSDFLLHTQIKEKYPSYQTISEVNGKIVSSVGAASPVMKASENVKWMRRKGQTSGRIKSLSFISALLLCQFSYLSEEHQWKQQAVLKTMTAFSKGRSYQSGSLWKHHPPIVNEQLIEKSHILVQFHNVWFRQSWSAWVLCHLFFNHFLFTYFCVPYCYLGGTKILSLFLHI